MKTINTTTFTQLLRKDPLYSIMDTTRCIINSLALRYSLGLYFCGYLYGVASGPVLRDIMTIKYIEDSISKNNSRYSVYSFKPYGFKLKEEIDVFKNKCREMGDDMIELEKLCLTERERLITAANENNDIQTHFLTTLLTTGLEFIYKDTLCMMTAQQFLDFTESEYEGCLLEVLGDITLTSDFIYKYFSENFLPLPLALYPSDMHNSDRFLKDFNPGAWDKYDPFENFKLFYSEKLKERHEAAANSKVEPKNTSATQQETPSPTEEQNTASNSTKAVSYAFYKSGEKWDVVFNGKRSLFNDSIGINYIHQILCAGIDGISVYVLAAAKDKPYSSPDNKLFAPQENALESQGTSSKGRGRSIKQEDISEAIEILEDRKSRLKDKKAHGEIDHKEYDVEMKHLDELIGIAYDTGRPTKDRESKKAYDKVTKSIQRALDSIKKNHTELYSHLYRYCKPKQGMYCYTGVEGISWKLYQ